MQALQILALYFSNINRAFIVYRIYLQTIIFKEKIHIQKLITSYLILEWSINYDNLFLKYFNLSILRWKFVP